MSTKVIKGKDLMIFAGDSSADVKSIAFATSHSLSVSAETSDVSTKDRASGMFGESEVTALSWEASSENLYGAEGKGKSYEYLFEKMIAGTAVNIVVGLPTSASEIPATGWTPDQSTSGVTYFSGKAYVTSLQLNAANGENASFSATLTGTGELTKTTVS